MKKKTKKKTKQNPTKPVLRSYLKRVGFLKWVVSHFPDNYKELTYLEPYCGGLGTVLNKDMSFVEILTDPDLNILEVYRSLRNEPKEFIKRVNRYKFCEETFCKVQKSSQLNKEDYLDSSVEEFLLRSMSKLEQKLKFSKVNFNFWKSSVKNLPLFSSRIKEVFIVNSSPLSIIKDFDFKETLLFCDPPHLYETKKGKTVYNSEIPVNEHIDLSHLLNSFKGKVLLTGVTSPLYSRLYKNWTIVKSKYKNKLGKTEVIWKNF
jgi:DNA adenine methylase